MNVYASLVVFAKNWTDISVIVDSSDNIPSWLMKEGGKESLELVRDGLYNISGVDKNWFPNFVQEEVLELNKKDIYIIWTLHCPSLFNLSNTNYIWKDIKELNNQSKSYNIIRHLYIKR